MSTQRFGYISSLLAFTSFAFLDVLQLCAVHLTSKGLPWANVVVSRCVGLRSRVLVKRVPWSGDVVPTGVNTVVARTIQFVNWPAGFNFAHQAYINMYRFLAQVLSSLVLGSKVFLVFTSHTSHAHSSRPSDQVGSFAGTLTIAFLTHSR